MKHQRVTPFRWVRRVPGRVYRNGTVRMMVGFAVLWEAIYWGTWQLTGRRGDNMNLLSWSGLAGVLLLLVFVNASTYRLTRKWHRQAEHKYALAVVARTELLHGKFAALPGPDGKWAVRCMCGEFIGTTSSPIMGGDSKLVPAYEKHCTEKVREIMDETKRKADALAAG